MMQSDPEEVKAVLAFIGDHPGVFYYEVERKFQHIYDQIAIIIGYLVNMGFVQYRTNDLDGENRLRLFPR
jgi:hypothetical protein